MTERTGFIYKATCSVTGKSYIGQSIRSLSNVKARHKRSARDVRKSNYRSAFACAVRKYGWNSFSWRIIKDGIPQEQLNQYEIELIAAHKTKAACGYNLSDGGGGPRGCVAWNKGKKHSPETIEKLRHAALNRSSEVRKRMSEAQKNRDPQVQEAMKIGIAKASQKMWSDPEYIAKHSESMKRPETIRKMSESAKRRVQRLGHCCNKALLNKGTVS